MSLRAQNDTTGLSIKHLGGGGAMKGGTMWSFVSIYRVAFRRARANSACTVFFPSSDS
jgi:hypothetical protein